MKSERRCRGEESWEKVQRVEITQEGKRMTEMENETEGAEREDWGEEEVDGAAENTPFNGQVAEKSCI